MQSTTERYPRHMTGAFAVSSTLSPAFDVRAFDSGLLSIPNPWGGGTCTFKCAPRATATYGPVRDSSGAVVQINPTAGAVHALHAAAMAAHYLKVVKTLAVTGGAREIGLLLKG